MIDPVQLVYDIAKVTDNLFLWTHYYSDKRRDLASTFEAEPILISKNYKGYKHYYFQPSNVEFLGGTRPYSVWLKRDDLFSLLREAGFKNAMLLNESLDAANGNWVTLFASKN